VRDRDKIASGFEKSTKNYLEKCIFTKIHQRLWSLSMH